MDMAKYSSRRSQQPENVNFEPIITGLKSDTELKFVSAVSAGGSVKFLVAV